jgi:flavin-dependent dehydrogenase
MLDKYDVVIMGGGPAGATLGALLAKTTELKVAIFERAVFPREHIGESFAHLLIPILEESGALPKVLASHCWIKKYGGIFNWDPNQPSVAFFDHVSWLEDGVHRWAMHVNRSEFDHILLNHARDLGVEVFEGTKIVNTFIDADGCTVTLVSGKTVRCSYFVDSSGRQNSIATKEKRAWLSAYKNIAIWQHYLNCDWAHNLNYEWNIFREKGLSPVGSFAFEHGWCWFIPVPKIINGERRVTHSIGVVTSPSLLKKSATDLTDPNTFLETVKKVPLLGDLIQNAEPISVKMNTATNYSMINRQFANYDKRWILSGDSAYFVDPLFSSGVGFACAQASGTALLLRTTFDPTVPESTKRELWHDYDKGWQGMAETYSLSIDQWYHAISKRHPESIYWESRGADIDLELREETFQALLSTGMTSGLLQVMTHGTRKMQDLDTTGPFMRASMLALPDEPAADATIALRPGVELVESVTLEVPGFKGFIPPPPLDCPVELKEGIGRYWRDPIKNSSFAPTPHARPQPCYRFRLTEDSRKDGTVLDTVEAKTECLPMWKMLTESTTTYGEFCASASWSERQLFKRLHQAKMIDVFPAAQHLGE